MVQNLKWLGVYLRSTFSNTLLQKVLKLVTLTSNGPEFYVATMSTVLSNSYGYLVDTLNPMKSLKLKDHPGGEGGVVDCCDAILLDVERLESDGLFNPNHLGYIIHIFEDTSYSIFQLWATQKYKEVMECVKIFFVCDKDVMQTDDIFTYVFLV